MGEAIGVVLPYAAGIALSPLPVIAVVLVLLSERPRANGVGFLVGWTTGLVVLVVVLHAVADAVELGVDDAADDGASWLRLALGVLLAVAGVRKLRARIRSGAEPTLPAWMSRIESLSPPGAIRLGGVLSLNPKNVALAIGAASGVAQLASGTDAVVGLASFVAVASSTVVASVAYAVVAGDAANGTLEPLRTWLTRNSDALVAVLFLVFSALLVGQALAPPG